MPVVDLPKELARLHPDDSAPETMIRFGPAASPRWFNQDAGRFNDYADLLKDSGAGAIEFVLLPGVGLRNSVDFISWSATGNGHFSDLMPPDLS